MPKRKTEQERDEFLRNFDWEANGPSLARAICSLFDVTGKRVQALRTFLPEVCKIIRDMTDKKFEKLLNDPEFPKDYRETFIQIRKEMKEEDKNADISENSNS